MKLVDTERAYMQPARPESRKGMGTEVPGDVRMMFFVWCDIGYLPFYN
jgi:hypothetical protein